MFGAQGAAEERFKLSMDLDVAATIHFDALRVGNCIPLMNTIA